MESLNSDFLLGETMIINNESVDISDLFDEKYFINKINDNIYLNNYQMIILDQRKIDYRNCGSMKDLIYIIDEYLDEDPDDEELEGISKEIVEFDYYHNTNK